MYIKIVLLLILAGGVVLGYAVQRTAPNNADYSSSQSENKEFRIQNSKDLVPQIKNVETTVFIPYWNIPASSAEVENYDTLIYFGVVPDENGKMISDLGFKNIESFIQNTSNRQTRVLTIRMLDTDSNLAILDDVSRQTTVVRQTVGLIEDYGFDGVVLDLELGVIPLGDVQSSITEFVERFSKEVHATDRTFAMTIYGDTLYRARPYDIQKLTQYVDQMYIMAYDFHKSRGEPGPNFPLTRRSFSEDGQEYDYDFQTMINDFITVVPREKITVLFGMYGYDWTLGLQGKPLKPAQAVPLKEIEKGIVPYCAIVQSKSLNSLASSVYAAEPYADCKIYENELSHEKYITYIDDEGYNHVLWYEDEESVETKIEYLKNQGIGSVGYWVWGYF